MVDRAVLDVGGAVMIMGTGLDEDVEANQIESLSCEFYRLMLTIILFVT